MSVKEEVLNILEENKGTHLSGEEIAGLLHVSRNAVWKAVKSLTNEGYEISGVNKKGYCLISDNDVLSVQGIHKYLASEISEKADIEVYKTINSTNTKLKELASMGEKEWKIIISEEQTEGRGRMNRQFFSPAKTGIYMSILLKPTVASNEALFITTMAAVSVAQAIEKVTGINTQIKWVNDIYCNNKKVCGILTEAALNIENSQLDYAVLGIGINIQKPENNFPSEIKNIATSLLEEKDLVIDHLRCKITAEVINNIFQYYQNLSKHEFMEDYIRRSMLIGKKVYIVGDQKKEPLQVVNINEKAALVVKHQNGMVEELSSGEVSVKPVQ